MEDICSKYNELSNVNIKIIIVHEESPENFEKMVKMSSKNNMYKNIEHLERKTFDEHFGLKKSTSLDLGFLKRGYSEAFKLLTNIKKNEPIIESKSKH